MKARMNLPVDIFPAFLGAVAERRNRHYPLVEGGVDAPIKRCHVSLELGAAGEVKRLLQQVSDLPGLAEFKVMLHLFDRLRPFFKEGKLPLLTLKQPSLLRRGMI
jgi:hypothetical protein